MTCDAAHIAAHAVALASLSDGDGLWGRLVATVAGMAWESCTGEVQAGSLADAAAAHATAVLLAAAGRRPVRFCGPLTPDNFVVQALAQARDVLTRNADVVRELSELAADGRLPDGAACLLARVR